jgi:hypothetical protein
MGHYSHMKTTLELSDNIMLRAKQFAQRRHMTLRSLTEQSLSRLLDEQEGENSVPLKPVTFKGNGLSPEFRGADWNRIRDAAYEGRGA